MNLRTPAMSLIICGLLCGCARSVSPGGDASLDIPIATRLFYDSNRDSFAPWKIYSRDGPGTARVRYKQADTTGPMLLELSALRGAPMGLNLRTPGICGRVSFEYKILQMDGSTSPFGVFVIPIRSSTDESSSPVEIGGTQTGDAAGAESHRKKLIIPSADADGQWHAQTMDYDFGDLAGAGYSIIAPRINEGTLATGRGTILFRNVVAKIAD